MENTNIEKLIRRISAGLPLNYEDRDFSITAIKAAMARRSYTLSITQDAVIEQLPEEKELDKLVDKTKIGGC